MHSCVECRWNNHHHTATAFPFFWGSNLIWRVDSSILCGAWFTNDLRLQIWPLCSSGINQKITRPWVQRMHKTGATFVFKKKITRGFSFFCRRVQGFHENRQRSNLLFSLGESKGPLIFSLPIPEWIIIVRLPWMTTCAVQCPDLHLNETKWLYIPKWYTVMMMVIKASPLSYWTRSCLGLLSFGDFAGTIGELCLCYVKTITFTFQRVDSSMRCLWGVM